MDSSADPKLTTLLSKLQQKYDVMGQDLTSYLDGLLHADYLTYWDYIHLDTLLSLQNPKTSFPDEKVFIAYHQITELYFNLVLWEIKQIRERENLTSEWLADRLDRINRYFTNLADSFAIMIDGMERDQFLNFRMSLLPASGFQSAQYRIIEIESTDLIHLVDPVNRPRLESKGLMEQLEFLYWRSGATELASGKKTLTLRQFEERYIEEFGVLAKAREKDNLHRICLPRFASDARVVEGLRRFDELANVIWPLSHMRSASRYLKQDPEDIKATGGTNWQKYLPPRFQKVSFFPSLWSSQEKDEWGKAGVERALKKG